MKLTLTNSELINLFDALHAIEQRAEGEDGTEAHPLPWRLVYAVARSIRALRGPRQDVEAARQHIVKRHSGGTGAVKADDPAWPACRDDLEALGAETVEVTVHGIYATDMERCPVSPVVLSHMLDMILTEDSES